MCYRNSSESRIKVHPFFYQNWWKSKIRIFWPYLQKVAIFLFPELAPWSFFSGNAVILIQTEWSTIDVSLIKKSFILVIILIFTKKWSSEIWTFSFLYEKCPSSNTKSNVVFSPWIIGTTNDNSYRKLLQSILSRFLYDFRSSSQSSLAWLLDATNLWRRSIHAMGQLSLFVINFLSSIASMIANFNNFEEATNCWHLDILIALIKRKSIDC